MNPARTLGRRQVYMLPTRYGLGFALMLLVLLLGSVNYNNGLGHALTFTLASVALVSMLYTQRNLHGLQVEGGACAPVFAGDEARITVCLRNPAAHARLGVVVEQQKRPVAPPLDLAPQARGCVELTLPTQRRGYVDSPPIVVATCYPLGLVRAWSRRVPLAARCLVYPRPAPAQPLPAGSTGDTEQLAAAGAGSDDFAGLREYHYGDPPQHVHWKAVARGQEWVTKQFAGEQGGVVWLDWATLGGRDTETRLSILCRWVLDAEAAGWRYGLRLPALTLAPARGVAHRHACLQALALFEA